MRLPILPEALDELDSEMMHLESERPGWGYKLLEEVAGVAELAAEHPQLAEKFDDEDVPDELDVRRFPIKRFGCLVIIGLVDGVRIVVAVDRDAKSPATGRSASRSSRTPWGELD